MSGKFMRGCNSLKVTRPAYKSVALQNLRILLVMFFFVGQLSVISSLIVSQKVNKCLDDKCVLRFPYLRDCVAAT